jgi:hypothetical protein
MDGNFRPQLEYNWPLSGGVSVPITMPGFNGAQFGLFNINLGGSTDSALEPKILQSVGSYGRQLGHLFDVVDVLVRKLDRAGLTAPELAAIKTFECSYAGIGKAKRRHGQKNTPGFLAQGISDVS